MSAPTDLNQLLALLREFGVTARPPGPAEPGEAFPVVVTLSDGTPLTLELPEPALLANLDPLQIGVAVVDVRGIARHSWGLARDVVFLAGHGSLLDTDLASLIQCAQRGVAGSLYLKGYRYFVAGLPSHPGDTLILIINAQEEQLSRRMASQKTQSTEVLRRIGKTFSMELHLAPLSVAAVHEVSSALDLTAALLWARRGDGLPLELLYSIGVNREGNSLLHTLDMRDGASCAAELVASRHQEVAVRNVFENAMTAELEAKLCYLKPGGLVVLPMIIGDTLIGVLELIGRHGDENFLDNRELFTTIAEHLALALHSALLYENAERLATVDPLTGIANHRTMQDFLHRRVLEAERNGSSMGVIMLDVDHFRSFNEEEGHDAGDEVLKRVVEAIRARIRTYDLPARYGGEEFTIIMPGADLRQAEGVAERIREEVAGIEYVTRAGRTRHVSASLGVSMFPATATEPDRLLKAADEALYQAKNLGRNRVVVYQGPYREAPEAPPQDANRIRTWLPLEEREMGEAFLVRTFPYRDYLTREMNLSKRQAALLEALILAAPGYVRSRRMASAGDKNEFEGASELRAIAPSLAALDERYDGNGPRGLAGDRIPLLARVLSVLWVLDEGAGAFLIEDPGRFDPEIVALVADVSEAA